MRRWWHRRVLGHRQQTEIAERDFNDGTEVWITTCSCRASWVRITGFMR